MRLTRAIEFSSSLRYAKRDLSDAENRRLYGSRASRHGHNFRLEVTLRGEPDPATGMVIDLKDVKAVLEREIEARFDHRDLNDDTEFFEKLPPTPEHFARVIFDLLEPAFEGRLDRIRLIPERDLWVDVIAEPRS